jgi:hypothetical protein
VAEDWDTYARTVIASLRDVLVEAEEEHRPLLLEVADYCVALGITIGLNRPEDGRQLLALVEPDETARAELETDAAHFTAEALA